MSHWLHAVFRIKACSNHENSPPLVLVLQLPKAVGSLEGDCNHSASFFFHNQHKDISLKHCQMKTPALCGGKFIVVVAV